MPANARGELTAETYSIGQVFSAILTAQNSCAVHEHCDSSCPNRVGVARYHELPSGARSEQVDLRAELARATANLTLSERNEPLTIPAGTPAFVYTPLAQPGRMIRLLKIRQAIFRADPVDCELCVFELDKAPEYGALSYCWGSGAADRQILCNGHVYHSRANLERALKGLRAASRPGGREEYIWADAICIDQSNIKEKSEQIMLMERIYSQAGTVYIDLGSVAGHSIPFGRVNMQFGEQVGGFGSADVLTHAEDPTHPFHYKTAFLALQQAWWTRTWVIQEIVLAKQAKYMFHGNIFTQQELDAILSKQSLRAHPERAREMMISGDVLMRGYLNYQKILSIKDSYRAGRKDALHFIQLTRDFVTTEPVDKIFGLLALLDENDRRALGPYYSSGVGEIYRRFAALQVQQGRVIQMLDSAGVQRRQLQVTEQQAFASWVPDWTAQSTGPKVISTLRPVPYSASKDLKVDAELLGDAGSKGLKLRGFLIDTIERVVPFLMPNGRADANFLEFHNRIRGGFDHWIADKQKQKKRTAYTDNEDAFARTLLMDDTYTGRNAITYSSPITQPATVYRGAISAWRAGNEWRMNGQQMSVVETFQMQASTACMGRNFAMTKDGRIGLVSPKAQEGDVVVIFHGGTVPYVLGDCGPGYLLLGDAYIHGVMNGEAVSRLRRGQDFVLG